MPISLPVPVTLLQITWAIIGFMFGRAFGKQLDHTIQETEWFKKQKLMAQWTVRAILDFMHHFWIGLLLMVYASLSPYPSELYWFGYGLFIDDAPDIPSRFAKYFTYLSNH